MRTFLRLAVIVCCGALMAACAKKPTTVPSGSKGDTVASTGATTGTAAGGAAGQGRALGTGSGSASQTLETTVYFDFDNSEVKSEYASLISGHAQRLAADKSLHVRLEGNTDERGSAEYNVALGERRAQSVKRALLLQGASEGQITTVSYGRERPVDAGHDEAAWARNRRVEIVYTTAR
jgi:peptidoglycan-associated lipoprotein